MSKINLNRSPRKKILAPNLLTLQEKMTTEMRYIMLSRMTIPRLMSNLQALWGSKRIAVTIRILSHPRLNYTSIFVPIVLGLILTLSISMPTKRMLYLVLTRLINNQESSN